nr:uncharacterized protein LOC115492903 isoform X3 [Taeniopygia guttata]
MAKSDGLLFKYRSPMSPYSLQSHGWWCGTDGARVTSRLFSGPCKQSRPMTCSIVPFEEEASSVTTKKNQGVPLLTIGSSSWLQRGVQLPFQVYSCHSISLQDCVCCSTSCRFLLQCVLLQLVNFV